ncbi:MAG: flagellar brake domain-containing protein [Lachnospiraceae bacterium]|nr:flagellar brake domain-containing protein [Lachnospiraceae bacterium]
MFGNLIQLGEKVDIRLVQQVEQSEKTGVSPHVYKCQVTDITDEGEIEITMPIENGRLVLLPLGIRFEFVFYTANGIYHSIGQIKERYKQENVHMMLVQLHSQLKKFQRREYYRYPCLMSTQFYAISKEDAETKTADQILEDLRGDDFYEKQKPVTIHDLSGGGVRLIGEEKIETDSYILLSVRLCNENIDKQYFLVGHVLDTDRLENDKTKFESRVQFVFENNRIREEIIRYIFEEERKERRTN